MIDLSKYVGQKITLKFRDGRIETGFLKRIGDLNYPYPYEFKVLTYTRDGKIMIGSKRDSDIVEIINPKPKPEMTGLAQRQPNIDLSKFVGKTVLVKITSSDVDDPNFNGSAIGKLTKVAGVYGPYTISGHYFTFNQNGERSMDGIRIEEIYEEGAFSLTLKEIPKVDEKVEEVVKLTKTMTTEQIAEVIAKLKGEQ